MPGLLPSRLMRVSGCLLTTVVVALFCFGPATVQAQKKLDWEYTGSVSGSLIAYPNVIADVYSVEAVEGERLVFNTSLTTIDTTIRVVGPDAAVEIFNDDRNLEDRTSHVAFVAAFSGTYLVIVSSYKGAGPGGEYALNFERRPCSDSECTELARRIDPDKSPSP